MEKQPEPPAEPIRFSTNVICPDTAAAGGSRFVPAGEPSPYHDIAEVPENLRPLVVTGEAEPEEENRPRGNFQLGEVYDVTDDGRLGRTHRRRVERQLAQLQAKNDFEEQIEEEAAADELPAEIAEDLQAQHESYIGLQTAQLAAAAERADQITDAIIASQEPPELYVKRGGRHYAPAHKARLKAGEEVFLKDPGDGAFVFIGTTDSQGGLPDVPITL